LTPSQSKHHHEYHILSWQAQPIHKAQLLNSDSTQALEAIQMIAENIKSYKKRTIDKKSTSDLIHEIIYQYHILTLKICTQELPEYISFRYYFAHSEVSN
jgi:hypothetical protein